MSEAYFEPDLTEEQRMILGTVADFTRDRLQPSAEAIDHEGAIPDDLLGELAELGLLGIPIPESCAGAGFDETSYATALAELARGSASVALHVVTQTTLFLGPLARHGSGAMVTAAAEGAVTGAEPGALAILEETGSWSARHLHTEAVADGDAMRLSGRKTAVLGGPRAARLLVIAREGEGASAFLVDATADGVRRGDPTGRLGMRGVPVCDVELDGVRVGADARVGEPGAGDVILRDLLARLHVTSVAISAGLARAARDAAAGYSVERRQFRRSISDFEAIREKLANMELACAVATNLVITCARILDAGGDVARLAESARIATSEAVMRATDDAIQVYGGYGYSQEYPVERFYRDARYLAVLGGGNDVLRVGLAARVLPES